MLRGCVEKEERGLVGGWFEKGKGDGGGIDGLYLLQTNFRP